MRFPLRMFCIQVALLAMLGCYTAAYSSSGSGSGNSGYSTSGNSGASSGGGSTSANSGGGSSGGGSTSGGHCSIPKCAAVVAGCAVACADTWIACAACVGPLTDECCSCLPSQWQQYCSSGPSAGNISHVSKDESGDGNDRALVANSTATVTYCSLNRTHTNLFGDHNPFEVVVTSVDDLFDCDAQNGIISDKRTIICAQYDYGSYRLAIVQDTCNTSAHTGVLNHNFVSLLTLHEENGRPLTAIKFAVLGTCMGNQAGFDVMIEDGESVLIDLIGSNPRFNTLAITYNEGSIDECSITLQTDSKFTTSLTLPNHVDSACSQRCADGSSCAISCPRARCSCLGGRGHQAWCSC